MFLPEKKWVIFPRPRAGAKKSPARENLLILIGAQAITPGGNSLDFDAHRLAPRVGCIPRGGYQKSSGRVRRLSPISWGGMFSYSQKLLTQRNG